MAVKTDVDVTSSNNPGDFIKSILEPGNYVVKINGIFLQPEKDLKFGERLILSLETKPIGGTFKGFPIDKNDLTKGNYLGRIGNVGYSKYSFKDFIKESTGEAIEKEHELQVAIQDLCKTLGLTKWYKDQNVKEHPDMAAFIKAFNDDKPFKEIWFNVCLAGREYMSQGKYINYETYFPFPHRALGVPYSMDVTKVIKFFASEHIVRLVDKGITNPPTETKENLSTQPAKMNNMSAQEAAFMNEKKEPEEKPVDIIQADNSLNPYMPWEEGYTTWKPGDKGPE